MLAFRVVIERAQGRDLGAVLRRPEHGLLAILEVHGFVARPLLNECRLPVCSPVTSKQRPLVSAADLEAHTLLHVTTMPKLWADWLTLAGHPGLRPAAALTLDHFYLSIQAAIDGLGIALGPMSLVTDDLTAKELLSLAQASMHELACLSTLP